MQKKWASIQVTLIQKRNDSNPAVKRLLGTEGNLHEAVGVSTTGPTTSSSKLVTMARFTSATSELTHLQLGRGGTVNDLWTNGGLIYAPPLR